MSGIKSHIKRSLALKAKATLGCIQLHGGDTKIEKNAINWIEIVFPADSLEINEVVVN
ncbi:unnamed protein product [marine sediment metagenome]|uniref:Uncharacterized protein n=1 Tax=marine sediment metagenome TaxID=412755 RepID=X1HU46_9ZZZZ